MKSHIKYKLIVLLPFSILLSYISSRSPNLVEKIYSNGIYKFIAQIISITTGILPFSLAELIIILVIILGSVFIFKTIVTIISHKKNVKKLILNSIVNIFVFISLIYFIFTIIWGLNYHRLPLSNILDIEIKESSIDELEQLCNYLIEHTNKLRNKVLENPNGTMRISYDLSELFSKAEIGYNNASTFYPEFSGNFGRPKKILLSEVMSYMGVMGIYFPFTSEANININIPHALIPSTICHEMAHQRGFAREDEANYIAFFTCRIHPDVEFQYSGYLLALIYSMDALHEYDRKRYIELVKNYNEGLKRDLQNIRLFWEKYEGPVDEIQSKVNDIYLKSNLQEEGIKSYGRMVNLLIGEYRKNKLITFKD